MTPVAPSWLVALEEAHAARAAGVILTGNTADRVLLGVSGFQVGFLRYALAHHFQDRGYTVGYFAAGTGFEVLQRPGTLPGSAPPRPATAREPFRDVPLGLADPALVLAELGRVLRHADSRAVVILDHADLLVAQSRGMPGSLTPPQAQAVQLLHAWAQDDSIRQSGNFLVIVSHEDAVNEVVRSSGGYRMVRVDLPDEPARQAFLQYLAEAREQGYADQLGGLATGMDRAGCARAAAGLRLTDIEWLFRRAAARREPVGLGDIRTEKQHAIAQLSRDLVEVIEPTVGFSGVAGATHAKQYFRRVRTQWQSGAASCPQAVLLAGVPGCGKSHIVRAIASEYGVPLLAMRNVRDAFVGQSERNLERVLWIAENLAPCILWTDELDQAVGQRNTGQSADGGTSERMLARLFEYFGSMDKRGRILWLGATNRPDTLDPALLDRFQVVIPWIHPTARDRAELLPLLAHQVGRVLGSDVAAESVASHPALEMLTVRSLQEIVVAAAILGDAAAGTLGTPIGLAALEESMADYKPTYDPTEHIFIALKALQMASFSSLLPWHSTDGDQVTPPRYVADLLDPRTGRLDTDRLLARIAELEQVRAEQRWRR